MSTQFAQGILASTGSRRLLTRRTLSAAFFGNLATMASTRNGGVAETHDKARPVHAGATLAFATSEDK